MITAVILTALAYAIHRALTTPRPVYDWNSHDR